MQPKCLDWKATDRHLFKQYTCIYLIGSWGAIETNMATEYFYELMSALNPHIPIIEPI